MIKKKNNNQSIKSDADKTNEIIGIMFLSDFLLIPMREVIIPKAVRANVI